jgi:hypothetical protein
LNENQRGFRKGYSTLDCIYSIHAFFEIIKKKKQKMYCAFVDFEKAFDKVWRVAALWYKLLLNNINGTMYNFIVNMYNSIKSCIVYNENKSDLFSSEVGVRQGENLFPFLFAVFLNDLEQFMEGKNITGLESISSELEAQLEIYLKMFAILYTDDTVLMSETSDGLQTFLNNVYEYSKLWKLKVNIDKTKIMVFSTSRTAENVHFLYNEKEIETVTEPNYLGVTFTKNGKFKLAKQKNIEKATKAMYEVIRRGKRHNLLIECLLDLFDKIVKPILLYGCEEWGFSDNYVIEKNHLKYCKLILHLRQSTPNFMIYGELGRFPLYIYI